MKFAGIYGIAVGILIFCQWAFFIMTAQVPEIETSPLEIAFHLAAEFMTALILIASGVAILKGRIWATRAYFVASGMLLYALVNSAGYFLQLRHWPLIAMFATLLVLTAVSIGNVVRDPDIRRSSSPQ